jgi:hypothetical protein
MSRVNLWNKKKGASRYGFPQRMTRFGFFRLKAMIPPPMGCGVLFSLFFFLVFLGCPQIAEGRLRILELMQQAKQAHQEGRLQEARRFWKMAKSLSPQLAEPEWLKTGVVEVAPEPDPEPVSPSSRLELLSWARRENSSAVRLALEAHVTRHPTDEEMHVLLLELAVKAGDVGILNRHHRGGFPYSIGRIALYLLLILINVGVAWKIFGPRRS